MNKERIDDLVDVLGERFAEIENTFVIRNQQELVKYVNNPKTWLSNQRANAKKYKGVLVSQARAKIKELNSLTEKVYFISYNEVEKDAIKITQTEIAGKIPSSYADKIANAKKENIAQMLTLANATLKQYQQDVRMVNALSTPDNLYDTIKNQMTIGIDKGIKIAVGQGSNVKNWSFKSYMEMNTRTTVHQEIAKEQIKSGADVGNIFYMCDVYADSADDHADYQGKLYYNAEANIPDNVQKWIVENNILSMQEVEQGEPFLITRPNCRHQFAVIPTDVAMGFSEEKIIEKEGLSKGVYKDENYSKTQEQRYNERTIRKYKTRETAMNELYKTTGDKSFLDKANQSASLVRKWQKENRELIKDNPKLLKRDYDRENIRVITQDLGVRYDVRKELKESE